MTAPRVSVLLSVHNGEPWVAEAVESVLRQTFTDFEFIVVDDGSTDATGTILERCGDPRLTVVHQPWMGLTASLNRALRLATAPLLARMDADDVALPERFERQLAFLDAHPDVGLLGTGCHEISPAGEILRTIRPPEEDGAIRRALIQRNPFVHSSVMMRRSAVERVAGYNESLQVAQDYDLWMRLTRITRMANLAEPLVLRRLTPGMVSRARDTERLRTELRIKRQAITSGAYPARCAIYLVKPLLGLAIPARLRGVLRRR